MLSFFDLPLSTVVYTFVEHDDTATHIASNILLDALQTRTKVRPQGWPVTDCVIGGSLAAALERGDLGVEPPHALRLPETALEAPAMVGQWGDSDHILIDGAHRLWRRWKRGDKEFPAYVVPEALWRMFTISDMPGTGEEWREFNRTAEVRTPELEFLHKLLGGK